MKIRMFALLVVTMLTSACATMVEIEPLPAFNVASGADPVGGRSRVFKAQAVDWGTMPALVPFAVVKVRANMYVSLDGIARAAYVEAKESLRPDVLVVGVENIEQVGAISQYWGWGVATQTPVYARWVDCVCYRLAPVKIGFQLNNEGMVVALSDDSGIRDSGLTEGDTLLSIAGATVDPLDLGSSFAVKLLSLAVGEEVKIVWIRPGAGRMEGAMRCAENPPTHLDLRETFDVERWRPKRKARGGAGKHRGGPEPDGD